MRSEPTAATNPPSSSVHRTTGSEMYRRVARKTATGYPAAFPAPLSSSSRLAPLLPDLLRKDGTVALPAPRLTASKPQPNIIKLPIVGLSLSHSPPPRVGASEKAL